MKGLLSLFAKRYIAGTDKADAIAATKTQFLSNTALIDLLGENVKMEEADDVVANISRSSMKSGAQA